jgi:5-methylcytosine-specific restriction enzyme subunit McrC
MRVTSAIPVRNLYYLYAYAWDQFHFTRRVDTGHETGPDAAAFFARILLQGCQQIFRRGVDRVYHTFEEERAQLRGRINPIKTTIFHSLARGRVWCEFAELQFDSVQNRLLKATLLRLRQNERVPKDLASEIRKAVRIFDSLGVRDIKPRAQSFRRVQLHRNNAFYGFLLHVCELVHYGLFPEHHGSAGPFASVLEDETRMDRIFERFVRNFFRHEQKAFSVTSERIAWDLSQGDDSALSLLPSMHTDVTLRGAERTIIIDTKYYAQTLHSYHERKTLRSNHLYQLFAYVKNLERRTGPDVRAKGILLYPTVQEEVQFEAIIQGHRINANTIDLAQPWERIRERLLCLVAERS